MVASTARLVVAAVARRCSSSSSGKTYQLVVSRCVRGTCLGGLSTISSAGESLLDRIGDGSKSVAPSSFASRVPAAAVVDPCGGRLSIRRPSSSAAVAVLSGRARGVRRRRCRTTPPRSHRVFFTFFPTIAYRHL
jgi:hypothetical protein